MDIKQVDDEDFQVQRKEIVKAVRELGADGSKPMLLRISKNYTFVTTALIQLLKEHMYCKGMKKSTDNYTHIYHCYLSNTCIVWCAVYLDNLPKCGQVF